MRMVLPLAPVLPAAEPALGPNLGVRGSVASPPRRFCSLASEAISESWGLVSSCKEAATRATERSLGRRLARRVTALRTTFEDRSEEERDRFPPCPNGDPIEGPVEGERGTVRDRPAPAKTPPPPVDEELSWPESDADARASASAEMLGRVCGKCDDAGGGVLGVLKSESGGPMTGVLGAREAVVSSSSICIISSSPSSGSWLESV